MSESGSAVKFAVTVMTNFWSALRPLSITETILVKFFQNARRPLQALLAAWPCLCQFLSRQDRHVPAPDRYTRLATDTTGFRRRFATKSTNSCQFDSLRTLAEIVMLGESILAVCHQWLGTNRSSPGSRTKVVGTALAKRGNLSKSGLSTLLSNDKFLLFGET